MNTYIYKETKLRSIVSNNSFVPRIWGKYNLLRTVKQPPVRGEGDPSLLQEGREKFTDRVNSHSDWVQENMGAITMTNQNLKGKDTLLVNKPQKEEHS